MQRLQQQQPSELVQQLTSNMQQLLGTVRAQQETLQQQATELQQLRATVSQLQAALPQQQQLPWMQQQQQLGWSTSIRPFDAQKVALVQDRRQQGKFDARFHSTSRWAWERAGCKGARRGGEAAVQWCPGPGCGSAACMKPCRGCHLSGVGVHA